MNTELEKELYTLMDNVKTVKSDYGKRLDEQQRHLDQLQAKSQEIPLNRGGKALGLKGEIADVLNTHEVQLKSFLNGDIKHLKLETKAAGDMLISTHLSGGTASISDNIIGPVGMAYRLVNVRDLFRQAPMQGMYLPMLKDNGGEGVPAPVVDGANKPDIDFDLAEATAKAETIAGVTTVHKAFFEDIKNARNWLTDRLMELYNAAEADQLLNGNGTSPNLKGLNTTGNFTAASGAATIDIEQIIQGLLQMRILKRRASGIIINPASLESLILNKATGGSLEYNLPSVVSMSPVGQLTVMGVPVIDVAEQPSGVFTIHDNSGSLYAVRQGITIEFFDQTYAKQNKILIRIEARIAFPNFGTSYTVKGSFS